MDVLIFARNKSVHFFLRFEPSTGYFGVMRNGKINTFFRPDGDAAARLKYFKDQL
jgi:filamentous hemagglutinin